MKYILDKRYRLRGWYKLPCGVYDMQAHEARFFDRRFYDLIMQCDAAHDIDVDALAEPESLFFQDLLESNVVRPARDLDFLRKEQLDQVAGGDGIFGDTEEAPDGHDMGCFMTYHGKAWSRENNTYCRRNYYCYTKWDECVAYGRTTTTA